MIIGGGGGVRGPLDDALEQVAPEAAALAPSRADVQKIGVVFVHGIGDQQAGTTLVSWAKPLVRLMAQWSATTPGVIAPNDPVTMANIDFSGTTFPTIELAVPGSDDHAPQHWVLTESWWSTRVLPPSISEMFRWLVPGEMIRIFRGIIRGNAAQGSLVWRWLDRLFMFLFMVPSVVGAVLLYLVFRILRVIPIRALRELAIVRGLEFFLVDWFGDVRILLSDRGQAANIRRRVALSIQALQAYGCASIVLVGHSGGTIVSYMTLTDPAYLDLKVERLITHGQALNMAWGLGHAGDPNGADREPDRLYEGDRLRTSLADVIKAGRPGLRWHDFWATHDPAPSGGFGGGGYDVTTPSACGGSATRVFNRMGLRGDHGAYWDNDEEFVLPVARLIEGSAGSGDSRFFPAEPDEPRANHRQARVRILAYGWAVLMISTVAAVAISIVERIVSGQRAYLADAGQAAYDVVRGLLTPFAWLGALVDFPEVPDRIDGLPAHLLGIAGIVVAYWLVGKAMVAVWNAWDGRERVLALQPSPDWRSSTPLAIQVGLCAGAGLGLFFFAVSGVAATLTVPALAVMVALVLAWMYRRTGTVCRGAGE